MAGPEICINNNRCGLDPQTVTKSHGLAQLQSRANRIGAELAWQRLDPGMRLTLTLHGGEGRAA
ncbi:MAG: hypothetical protein IPN53_22695 [Comamonadaceae bacterium]|nr:hypothetical protein [Comamonadaceae bacterium]